MNLMKRKNIHIMKNKYIQICCYTMFVTSNLFKTNHEYKYIKIAEEYNYVRYIVRIRTLDNKDKDFH